MCRFWILLVTLTVAGSLHAAPVPKGAKKTDYSPMAVGHKWEYSENDDVKTTEIISMDKDKDARIFTFAYKGEKSPPASAKRIFRIENDDIFSMHADGTDAEKPGLVMKRILKPNDEWKSQHQWKNGTLWNLTHKVGEAKKIKTPAGEFTALPLEQSYENGTELRWYADGIGMIRKEKDGKLVSELKSFTPGK